MMDPTARAITEPLDAATADVSCRADSLREHPSITSQKLTMSTPQLDNRRCTARLLRWCDWATQLSMRRVGQIEQRGSLGDCWGRSTLCAERFALLRR